MSGVHDPIRPDVLARLAFLVTDELAAASRKFAPMHSPHEGLAVIHEEYRELMLHVYGDTGRSPAAAQEAFQVAAMGLRYVVDLCELP